MNCCIECFSDPQIQAMISANGMFRLRKRGLVGARLLHLVGASPLDKEKHKALYYNKAIRT